MVAHIKAVAVCPEGNELFEELSGRVSFVVYFSALTKPAMRAAEKTLLTVSSFHELRPSSPASFSPQVAASGTYCV
uniref:hypothetical protein n=1 Tax=Phocaeicola coprophilus TaxID=387090 RepID=UPI00402622CD